MKNAIICHGTGSKPESFWFPSIKKFLEKNGYQVWAPQLPEADCPNLNIWLPFILDNGKLDEETIIIGHSAGSPLILSILENINVRIDRAILVSGYARPKGKDKEKELILQDQYDWNKIRKHVNSIIFINSDNDPWGCNHEEGLFMWNNIGGTLILREGEGHMGSDSFNQPYREFPLLEKLLEMQGSNNKHYV